MAATSLRGMLDTMTINTWRVGPDEVSCWDSVETRGMRLTAGARTEETESTYI